MEDRLNQPIEVGDRVVHITRQGSWMDASIGIIVDTRTTPGSWRGEIHEVRIRRTHSEYSHHIGVDSRWILAKNIIRV